MSTQGAERSLQVKKAMEMADKTLTDKIRKLDKLNEYYISLLVDTNKVGLHLSEHDAIENPTAEQAEWANKAGFAQEKMQDDLQELVDTRSMLQQDIEKMSPENPILDACEQLDRRGQYELTLLLDPESLKPKNFLEEEYPADDNFLFERDHIIEESSSIDVGDDPVRRWAPEPSEEDVYNAFFVQAAKQYLGEDSLKELQAQAQASLETYTSLRSR